MTAKDRSGSNRRHPAFQFPFPPCPAHHSLATHYSILKLRQELRFSSLLVVSPGSRSLTCTQRIPVPRTPMSGTVGARKTIRTIEPPGRELVAPFSDIPISISYSVRCSNERSVRTSQTFNYLEWKYISNYGKMKRNFVTTGQ